MTREDRHMKRTMLLLLAVLLLFSLTACKKVPKNEYHPSGMDGEKLYVNIDGNTYVYERYQPGVGSLTQKKMLDMFETNTKIEGIAWAVYSTEEYPDLSYVLVISGTNIYWTYRISSDAT